MQRLISLIVLGLVWGSLSFAEIPLEQHSLILDTPSLTWDEALPLGNGLLGALVWGDGAPLKISLDRTDLWDLRPVPEFESKDYSYKTMRQWVGEGKIEDLHTLYDKPYGNAGPTKIPAGRIELKLGENLKFKRSVLPLASPSANVEFDGGLKARVLLHATEPVGLIEIATKTPVEASLVAPPFSGVVVDPAGPGKISAGDLASLGYPAPVEDSGPDWKSYTQEGWGGFRFAVVLKWTSVDIKQRRSKEPQKFWRAAWSVATSKEGQDPLEVAKKRVEDALSGGWEGLQVSHQLWWMTYWNRSWVEIPNKVIEKQWYLDTYKFGAASRRGAPPISLQGPWTADDGRIPPWKGDYHHDLNTQLSYWPCYSSNRLDEGLCYLDWLWKTKPNCEAWTQRFFGLPGLNVPMTGDIENNQIGGWHQYTHSSTTAAWLAHHFYQHWRYSHDVDFLQNRAYPYIRDAATFLEAVTEKGPDGKRTLPLSSSPEINDDRLEAWFPSITNYDLSLIRWTFYTAAELAQDLDLHDDLDHWAGLLNEMPELSYSPEDHRLLVAKDTPLKASHRHFSHLMAIYPLGLIRWENGDQDRQTIQAALAEMDRVGTSQWCGYSFAWEASLAARAQDGARAEKALETFASAFCLRNSFHANGDQSGKGYSTFTYRPFTLEGNFASAAGLQEMLLQSYGGVLRLFPAIPSSWQNTQFESLRAEGAFLVSAERRAGKTERVTILSEKQNACILENPFDAAGFHIEGDLENPPEVEGEEIVIHFLPGQRVTLLRKG
jgi:alpha-L-fucosidase 2